MVKNQNTDSLIVCIITNDIYRDTVENVETRFVISNYELDRPLPTQKIKKSNWINER